MVRNLIGFISLLVALATFCQSSAYAGFIENEFKKAIDKVKPSVVRVRSFKTHDEPNNPHIDLVESGSGVVVSDDGLIITAAHLIAVRRENALILPDVFDVMINDRIYVPAELIGYDEETDLGLLKIQEGGRLNLVPIPINQKNKINPGQKVLVMGYAASFKLNLRSFSQGVIVNAGAYSGDLTTPFIVTDARTLHGNNGGPVINHKGELVGINSHFDNSGLGYSVPADIVVKMLPQLLKGGTVRTGWIGIYASYCINLESYYADFFLRSRADKFLANHNLTLPKVKRGLMIMQIDEPRMGDSDKIHLGDAILSLNGKAPIDEYDFVRQIIGAGPNAELAFEIERDGKVMHIKIRTGEFDWKHNVATSEQVHQD